MNHSDFVIYEQIPKRILERVELRRRRQDNKQIVARYLAFVSTGRNTNGH